MKTIKNTPTRPGLFQAPRKPRGGLNLPVCQLREALEEEDEDQEIVGTLRRAKRGELVVCSATLCETRMRVCGMLWQEMTLMVLSWYPIHQRSDRAS